MASYDFYSLVSSIKDKSSQAMATLSSDLKEFSSIVQEDVTEVANTVRKTVHEQSEALRQRVEQQEQTASASGDDGDDTDGDGDGDDSDPRKDAEKDPMGAERQDVGGEGENKATSSIAADASSLFAFGTKSLEAMGSRFLTTADELLGALAGPERRAAHGGVYGEYEGDDSDGEVDAASARRYRLLALQEDVDTYTEPPMDTATFAKWKEALTTPELRALQDEVLAHYPTVATRQEELVPETVAEDVFWTHYLYKASLLAAQEQRGAELLEHALNDSDEEVSWDVESPRHGDDTTSATEDVDNKPTDASVEAVDNDSAKNDCEERAHEEVEEEEEAKVAAAAPESDGESWTELDEQRRETAPSPPPLSTSSTSSFVPVHAHQEDVYSTAGMPLAEHQEMGDDDLDWGDEDDEDEEKKTTERGTKPTDTDSVSADTQAPARTAGAGGAAGDWGDWD